MDLFPGQPPSLHDRISAMWARGVHIATRLAIAFGMATLAAIFLGAAVTDNAFVQILVTVFAAFGLWLPFAFALARVERFFADRRRRREARAPHRGRVSKPVDRNWQKLASLAPREAQRIAVIQRSLERSRLELGSAELDPQAHDLCVLIDRRLPELIEHELDSLAPDDRNRSRQISELVELIEQFARHCSRSRADGPGVPAYEAAILRRRFEDRLAGH